MNSQTDKEIRINLFQDSAFADNIVKKQLFSKLSLTLVLDYPMLCKRAIDSVNFSVPLITDSLCLLCVIYTAYSQ